MAPQTRSSAKYSPGRSTRNSVYGRSPLPPTKPRKSSTDTAPAKSVLAHEKKVQGKPNPNVSGTKSTPWLACRDAYGVFTTVAVSETGEGVHVRWYYPEDDIEVEEDEEDAVMATTPDEERDVTPQPTTAAVPDEGAQPPFPQTPMVPQPYDAGSVILTPVKKARPLQASPPRIGDKGVRCLFEKDGVLRDFNGVARIVLRHPVGSTTNLSREQVERLEDEREEKIFHVQVEKLMAERRRLEERQCLADSGCEDEMETDDTVFVSHSDLSDASQVSQEGAESESSAFRGPNGELLDCHGHQMLGREGTILIDSAYTLPERALGKKVFPASTNHPNLERGTDKANGLHRPRLGPEGTELID